MLLFLSLMIATLASEDLACVAAGLLVHRGAIGPVPAIAACALGIFAGDLVLWSAGRLGGRSAVVRRLLGRAFEPTAVDQAARWLEGRAGRAILASRFLPGTRLPLYVAAGFLGVAAPVFAAWVLLAVLLWVPPVVLLAAGLGETFSGPFSTVVGSAGSTGLAVVGVVLALRAARVAATASWVRRVAARLVRWRAGVLTGLARLEARVPVRLPRWRVRAVPAIARLRVRAAVGLSRWHTGGAARLVRSRVRAAARLARWRRWEFWPMWLFYAPVAAWVGLLALRYRGLSTLTAANPGIPDGGTVGESKFAILGSLPPGCTIPAALIEPAADVGARAARLAEHMRREGWAFPVILKPDVGQRGMGVKLIAGLADAEAYLARASGAVVAQVFHPGPFEAGVFYYRMPGRARGRIFSITDKHFPVVVGDGRSTLEELIWRHPRYRMQARTFLARHAERIGRVLGYGERFQLAIAGNHAQGTLFRDGRHLLTPALEGRIDEISRACPGFFVGRFDIRYSDVAEFKAGRDIAIVELNGATAESTAIYDPATSLFDAYRQLFTQWSIVFAIGAANRAAGASVSPLSRLIELVLAHLATEPAFETSD